MTIGIEKIWEGNEHDNFNEHDNLNELVQTAPKSPTR
jgi:hypothetical protein